MALAAVGVRWAQEKWGAQVGSLEEIVQDEDLVLSMEPEELAFPLLIFLADHDKRGNQDKLNRNNFIIHFKHQPAIHKALLEAWQWLDREGLICRTERDSIFITRRGQRLAEEDHDPGVYKRSRIIPKEFLHPVIAQRSESAFIRGDYDVAVFQAFKEVEVAVRRSGRFDDAEIGVQLMRKAFHPDNGPLTDTRSVHAEREALSALFAGAIGSYKNPHSHRNVPLDDPHEAAEMIVLASHLLKIVDARTPGQTPPDHAAD